jgi:adenylate cyclase
VEVAPADLVFSCTLEFARLLELDPALTISTWIARGGQSNAKLLTDGLGEAGPPE